MIKYGHKPYGFQSMPIDNIIKSQEQGKLFGYKLKEELNPNNKQDLRYVIINKLKTLDVKVRFYSQDLRYVIINKLKTLDVKVRFYSASLHKIPECMGIMRNIA